MSELRAPDPTLDALHEPVGIVHQSPLPAIAHRLPEGPGRRLSACLEWMPDVTASAYAAYFSVPCRECFPSAPAVGHPRTCVPGGGCPGQPHPHLAWQVAVDNNIPDSR